MALIVHIIPIQNNKFNIDTWQENNRIFYLNLRIQACGNCENDSSGCTKVTQSLFCVTLVQFTWIFGTSQAKLAKLYVIITVVLGGHLKIQAHYPNSFYWLVVGSTYVKLVTQISMGYAVINLRNPYVGYADFINSRRP